MRCVCVCVCSFLISSFFFNSEDLPTYFKVSRRSLQKNSDSYEMSLSDCLEAGICADGKVEPSNVTIYR